MEIMLVLSQPSLLIWFNILLSSWGLSNLLGRVGMSGGDEYFKFDATDSNAVEYEGEEEDELLAEDDEHLGKITSTFSPKYEEIWTNWDQAIFSSNFDTS